MSDPTPDVSASLAQLAEVLEAARATRSRLSKRAILAAYLKDLTDEDLSVAVTFLCGRPFPRGQNRTLSVGGSIFGLALKAAASHIDDAAISAAWLRHSDAGDAAADVWADHPSSPNRMTLQEMVQSFEKLGKTGVQAEKIKILSEDFSRLNSEELRSYVKILLSETRMGILEGTVEDAVAELSGQSLEAVRSANRHAADLGRIAVEARRGPLESSGFNYFNPVDCMLAHPAENSKEVVSRLGAPIWVEDKYDGVRCQLHRRDGVVKLYSRDRKDITRQFPDVHDAFAALPGSFALDGEIMILEMGKSMPFSRLQQRLNRVKPTAEILSEHPAALVVFDILALGDESLLDNPLHERRKRLETAELPPASILAPTMLAENEEQLEELFTLARNRGNEGLMCKDPHSPYVSGRRGYKWLKLKKALEPLDVVIVGAEWGHGKRKDVLSDYTFAVRDEASNTLANVGKAYGGLTDVEIAELTETLKSITIKDLGRYRAVEPHVVLEVAFNGIQKSARHKSGYALRFPRILRIRSDKGPADINTVDDVRRQYKSLDSQPIDTP